MADETRSLAALISPIALAELRRQPQNARPSGANRASISFELELTLEGSFSGNIFRCGLSYPLGDERNSMSSNVPSVSGTEDHEPEHAQDQDREAGGDYKQGEHRGTRLGLPRLGRGFDGLTLLSRCHAASISRILGLAALRYRVA